jgi:SAM-dependent methyltransferase
MYDAIMQLKQSAHLLGHTDWEQRRLIRQAQVLEPATNHFLSDAGIVSGMRVLDVGRGMGHRLEPVVAINQTDWSSSIRTGGRHQSVRAMGDVTMLVARLVGPQGKVVSIYLDPAAISTACRPAAAAGLDNTTFCQADISAFTDVELFDAIAGRLLLEFLPDPAAIIKKLCGLLQSGGIMAFQEPSWKIWLAYTSHLPLRWLSQQFSGTLLWRVVQTPKWGCRCTRASWQPI